MSQVDDDSYRKADNSEVGLVCCLCFPGKVGFFMAVVLSWGEFLFDLYCYGFAVPQTFLAACYIGVVFALGLFCLMQIPWLINDNHENR